MKAPVTSQFHYTARQNGQVEENEIGGTCRSNEQKKNEYSLLMDNIKIDLVAIG
jgi:hypothetical protein